MAKVVPMRNIEHWADKLLGAAMSLVARLDFIHENDHYKSVWTLYAIHGGDYSDGPKYDKELAKLRKAVDEAIDASLEGEK